MPTGKQVFAILPFVLVTYLGWTRAADAVDPVCQFLICKDEPEQRRPPSPPERGPKCEAQGDYVVVSVPWDDADHGLLIRSAPNGGATVRGVIPPAGIGVAATSCDGSWCEVKYGCLSGWAGSRYLSERSRNLFRVSGVSSSDPEGLNLRSGPGPNFSKVGSVPYNGANLIKHTCQRGAGVRTDWCLITYEGRSNLSGWASSRFLAR
jgi:uncharacterized protein YraI